LDHSTLRSASPEHDPALLAFVKCHVTSFPRWDLVRVLSTYEGCWAAADELASLLRRPPAAIDEALAGLEAEGVVEARHAPSVATVYRMPPREPSTRVAERLVEAARHSRELRQIIVAHVVGREHAVA
jgi:hypothetical protein